VIEQIEAARDPSDRLSAIDTAIGSILYAKSRLDEDIHLNAMFALSLPDLTLPFWREDWTSIAKGPPNEFDEFAEKRIQQFRDVKNAFENLQHQNVAQAARSSVRLA
jgi:hypothetical protein